MLSPKHWKKAVARLLSPIVLILATCVGLGNAYARPWHVAILVGADLNQPAAAQQLQALRTELTARAPEGIELFIDPLDSVRFDAASLDAAFMELIKQKYANQRIDLVIGVSDFSIDFAQRYHSAIWPDAPVLISSIPLSRVRDRPLPAQFTYLPFHIDAEGTLGLVATLQPSLKRLVVVAGTTSIDQAWIPYVQDAVNNQLNARWDLELWSGLTQSELLQRAASLDKDTAILFTTMYRDKDGHPYLPFDVAKALTAASSVPVYGWYSTYEGLAGGVLLDFHDVGKQTAAVAAEILNKAFTTTGMLPPIKGRCTANVAKLESLGLQATLPPGCEGINLPPSLWRDHRQLVLAILTILALQAGTILALLWQRRRRHLAEQAAAERASELTRATRIAVVGEMGAAITHEISQPLGAIASNADAVDLMLARGHVDMGEIREIVEDIQRDAMRASQILTRQRALMHKADIELVPLIADQALEDGIALLVPEARRRECQLTVDLRCGAVHVKADGIQLQQVLVNLSINAMDAMQNCPADRRRLHINTRVVENWWVMQMTDTGKGMDTHALPRIFESFYTTKENGTGLGLSIVRAIVATHGGRITATSTLGEGSTFEVRLRALGQESTWQERRRGRPPGATERAKG